MAFWSKNSSSPSETTAENPFRAIDPVAFDKGAKINDVSGQLRRLASTELEGSDVVAALQAALGAEIAALTARRNPTLGQTPCDTSGISCLTRSVKGFAKRPISQRTYQSRSPTAKETLPSKSFAS